jgi:hypothetical protein
MSKCEKFCKKTYLPMLKRLMKTKKYKDKGRYYLPYYSLTDDKDWGYKTCLQTFCNPTCIDYTPLKNTKKYKEKWRKSIKNGFNTSYTQEQIDNYKNKGAISGCVGNSMYEE